MDSAYPEPGVESDRIRDLLASDRRLIGQARALRSQAPLRTATFRQPLMVRVRRRLRHDRGLRLRLIYCALGLVLTAALGLWLRGRSHAVHLPIFSALPSSQPLAHGRLPRLVPEGEHEQAREHAAPSRAEGVQPTPPSLPEAAGQTASGISAERRLQRADVWLRVGTPQAARQARLLIEGALAELPGSVHGQVSLAEACLRLGDEACARRAVHTAVLARPWRSKYRELAERIDQAFTRDGAIVASGGPASVDTIAPAPAGTGRQRR